MASSKKPRHETTEYLSPTFEVIRLERESSEAAHAKELADAVRLDASSARLDETLRDLEDLVASIAAGTNFGVVVEPDPKEGRHAVVTFFPVGKVWRLYYGVDDTVEKQHKYWPVTDISRERKCHVLRHTVSIVEAAKGVAAKRAREIDQVVESAQAVIRKERGRL